MLRVRAAGIRSRCHPRQAQHAHQPLHPLAVHLMALCAQVGHHLAAAVERAAGVLLVDQTQQFQVLFAGRLRRALHIHGGAGDTCQPALPHHRHHRLHLNPAPPHFYRLSPDFFLSQSSSILSLPISPYRRSGSLYSFTGLGPRLPSNRVPARSSISFFHCETCTGCTPCSCAIWLMVFPRESLPAQPWP